MTSLYLCMVSRNLARPDEMEDSFRYHSLGLSRANGRDYLKRPEPLAWAFAVLMRPTGFGSRARLAIACLRRIVEARGLDDERRFKLLNFVRTYVKLDDKVAPEYEALLRRAQNQEVREMVMTWADEIKAEGRQEGHQEGEAKGRQEGVAKLQNVVMDLISQRFGRLSERTRRQIAAVTSLDELAELAKNVLKVHSPEELSIG